MGGNGSSVAAGILGIAVAIENLVNPPKQNDNEQQKKTIPKQRKKQRKTHEKKYRKGDLIRDNRRQWAALYLDNNTSLF
ncbi:MAG: hypothetical protein ACLSWQ_11700 [Oscillospiraceae bacterium]